LLEHQMLADDDLGRLGLELGESDLQLLDGGEVVFIPRGFDRIYVAHAVASTIERKIIDGETGQSQEKPAISRPALAALHGRRDAAGAAKTQRARSASGESPKSLAPKLHKPRAVASNAPRESTLNVTSAIVVGNTNRCKNAPVSRWRRIT